MRIFSKIAKLRPVVLAPIVAGFLSVAGIASASTTAYAETDIPLTGNFTFALTGQSLNGGDLQNNYAVMAGSLAADCRGRITGGEADRGDNFVSTNYSSLSGTYNVNLLGQGKLVLKAFTVAGGTTPVATYTFRISVISAASKKQHVLLTEIDNLGTLHGTLDAQDTTSFASPVTPGNYNYFFNGPTIASGTWETVGGVVNVTAPGRLNSFLYDDYAQGNSFLDQSAGFGGRLSSPVDSHGRGTILVSGPALGFYQNGRSAWAYYQVNATHFLLISTDQGAPFIVPALVTFAPQPATLPASLAGTYVFTMNGAEPQTGNDFALAPAALGGTFTCDANGNLTSMTLDSNDQNGFLTFNSLSQPGTCTLDSPATGRGTISFILNAVPDAIPNQFTVYQTVDGLQLLGATPNSFNSVYGGAAYLQAAGVTSSLFHGDFGGSILSYNQATANGIVTYGGLDLLQGRFEAHRTAALGGHVGVNAHANNGGIAILHTPLTDTTGFVDSGSGRLTGGVVSTSATSSTQNVYVIDANTALTFETDSSVGFGMLQKPTLPYWF